MGGVNHVVTTWLLFWRTNNLSIASTTITERILTLLPSERIQAPEDEKVVGASRRRRSTAKLRLQLARCELAPVSAATLRQFHNL